MLSRISTGRNPPTRRERNPKPGTESKNQSSRSARRMSAIPARQPCAAAVTAKRPLTGWRGETVSAQTVVSAPAAVGGLTCTVGDFRRGRRRDAARHRPGPLREVSLSDPSCPKPCGTRPENNPTRWWPTCSTRPLRATWRPDRPVPYGSRSTSRATPSPADYTAEVAVKARRRRNARTLAPDVTGRTLPAPRSGPTTSTCGSTRRPWPAPKA